MLSVCVHATILSEQNKKDPIITYQKLLAQNPANFETLFNLATEFFKKEQFDEAAGYYKKALVQEPESIDSMMRLAHIREKQDKLEQAVAYYEQVVALSPNLTYAFLKLASIHKKQKNYKQALDYYKKVDELKPNDTIIMSHIASILSSQGEYKQAAKLFLKIAKLEPKNMTALYNAGYSLKTSGQIDSAITLYNKVLEISPDYEPAKYAIPLAYLYKGDFENGWKHYEFRLIQEKRNAPNLRKYIKEGTVNGKIIYLVPEGGVGDTIQFIRYAKLLHDQGAHVIVAERPVLQKLLANCPYIDQLICIGQKPTKYHDYASIMSLPAIYQSKEEEIPTDIPYIFPDKKLETKWQNYFEQSAFAKAKAKVGLCWEADLKNDESRPLCAHRSIPLIKLEKLSHIPNIEFYSLQKNPTLSRIEDMPEHFVINTFGPDFDSSSGPFMDTAAIMKQLDLVITVDTAIAHLAGALGVPVWLMLPYNTDWRWISGRTTSPWYPNMKIFKQPKALDWDTVTDNIYKELQLLTEKKVNKIREEKTPKKVPQSKAPKICEEKTITQKVTTQQATTPAQSFQENFKNAKQLAKENKFEEAERILKQLDKLYPKNAVTTYNTAYMLKMQGKFKEAIQYYIKTIKLDPDLEEAYLGLAKSLLAIGIINRETWEFLEYRFSNFKEQSKQLRYYDLTPQDLANKTVYIISEWGLGDMMQFVRYAKCLKELGATVIISAHKPLQKLFSLCPYIDKVITSRSPNICYDYKIPIMSLPLIFNTTQDTIPADIPYLYADPDLMHYWGEKLTENLDKNDAPRSKLRGILQSKSVFRLRKSYDGQVAKGGVYPEHVEGTDATPFIPAAELLGIQAKRNKKLKIGLCWHAKPIFIEENYLTKRSVPLKEFAELAELNNISFYSLQKIFGLEELENLPDKFIINTFGPNFDETHGRFMDTAAVIQNLDLVITADTSIAHLAGALGKPVWVLLPYVAEWRWLQSGHTTPWYPNMRLFRQKIPSDWSYVIKEIKEELKKVTSQIL